MVRRGLSGNAEQKDRMKMKQSDRQRTPGGQPFAASGNERKKGADFSALTLRMDRIPDGFQCRFRQETDRCLPEITATGTRASFLKDKPKPSPKQEKKNTTAKPVG